jgi:hypothetical protein
MLGRDGAVIVTLDLLAPEIHNYGAGRDGRLSSVSRRQGAVEELKILLGETKIQ